MASAFIPFNQLDDANSTSTEKGGEARATLPHFPNPEIPPEPRIVRIALSPPPQCSFLFQPKKPNTAQKMNHTEHLSAPQ
jgi:hypothetical protein